MSIQSQVVSDVPSVKFFGTVWVEGEAPPNGFASLDFCRNFGIPDRVSLPRNSGSGFGGAGLSATVEIPESLASQASRTENSAVSAMGVDRICVSYDVDVSAIKPGELTIGEYNQYILSLTPERTKQLFMTAFLADSDWGTV